MSIVEIVKNHPNFAPALEGYVSLYEQTRCYGGPEEGGWWYTVYRFLGGIPCKTEAEASRLRAVLEDEAEKLAREANRARKEEFEFRYGRDPIAEIEDDFCSGESIDEKFLVTVETVAGEMDNSKEPPPHWE